MGPLKTGTLYLRKLHGLLLKYNYLPIHDIFMYFSVPVKITVRIQSSSRTLKLNLIDISDLLNIASKFNDFANQVVDDWKLKMGKFLLESQSILLSITYQLIRNSSSSLF